MQDEDLTLCLTRYFKQPSIDRKDLARLITFIEQFSFRQLQPQMIQKIFRVAESTMGKDNLKVVIKRYFHIVNEILEKDENLQTQFQYRDAISHQIVPQFISMLRNVLNYGPMDLLPDMKLYRKRWAKRITDQAYSALQAEALRQLKLDLDKGFSEENVRKLTKLYQKRQFTKTELQRYLPGTNTNNNNNYNSGVGGRKGSYVSSQSSQGEERPRKRYKKQSKEGQVAEKRNESSDMVMPRHSFIPSNSTTSSTFGNGVASDRRPSQFMYPPTHPFHHPSYVPINPYALPPRVINSVLVPQSQPQLQPHLINQPQPNIYHQGPYSFPYPSNDYGPPYQNYQNPGYHMDPRATMPPQMPPKLNKIISKMEAVRSSWSMECKCCGVLISTSQKYEEHMSDHFLESQKGYQSAHNRTQHQRRTNKPLLPSQQQWVQANRTKLQEKVFKVAIEDEVAGNEVCLICKGELKVNWSDGLDQWVYEDAIRTSNRDGRQFICHAECYHAIDQFQRSSEDSSKDKEKGS